MSVRLSNASVTQLYRRQDSAMLSLNLSQSVATSRTAIAKANRGQKLGLIPPSNQAKSRGKMLGYNFLEGVQKNFLTRFCIFFKIQCRK